MLMTKVSSVLVAAGLSAIVMIGLWDTPHGFGSQANKERNSMSTNTTSIVSSSGYDITPLNQAQIDALAVELNEEERRVILNDGTEPAFCGTLTDNKKDGTYICRLCNLPLFKSDAKFTSGTGWPSFFQPYDEAHVGTHADMSFGMVRTEIVCARCDGHLGHVFDDGPMPTGKRFCVNSVSLVFVDEGDELPEMPSAQKSNYKVAYFAGGCFWGVEDRFAQLDGVHDAAAGAGVQLADGIIQDQEGRIAQQGPGNGDALLLSAG